MKTQRLAAAAVTFALSVAVFALSACATQYDSLIKTVPVGSGTSHLAVLAVHGANGQTMLLIDAEPSANGAGYTIYGDIVSASAYVADAHKCD